MGKEDMTVTESIESVVSLAIYHSSCLLHTIIKKSQVCVLKQWRGLS